nr:myelin-associated glycoprotein-like [Nerophis lumbriciformis]
MPSSVQILTGSCVYVPCTFTIQLDMDKKLDDTCAVIWYPKAGPKVFDSRRTKTENARLNLLQGNVVGNVLEKNCSTIMEPKSSKDVGPYHFRLECANALKYSYKKTSVKWDFQDSAPQPTIEPTTVEVVEGTVLALKCQAPVLCPTLPPLLTWAPELGTVQEEMDANVSAVMTFNTTYLHDNVNVTCSAVYTRQKGYTELSTEQVLTLRVLHAPKNTSVSASPPGSLPDGSAVTLKCSGVANPPITDVNWYRVNDSGATLVGSGQELTFNVTKLSEESYYCENNNIHGAQSAEPFTVDVTFAPEILTSSDCQDVPSGTQCSCISQANPPPLLQWEWLGVLVNNSNQKHITEQSLDKLTRRSVIIFKSLDSNSGTSLVCVSYNQFGYDRLTLNVPLTNSDMTALVCSVVAVVALLILSLVVLYFWRKPDFNFQARWRQANSNAGASVTNKHNVSQVDNFTAVNLTRLRSLNTDEIKLQHMGSDN